MASLKTLPACCLPPVTDVAMLLHRRSVAATCLALAWCFGIGLVVGAGQAAAADPLPPEQEKFFEDKVRPLLATKCQKCHGAEKQESGLRLDSRAALLAGGDTGEAMAIAESPDKSL